MIELAAGIEYRQKEALKVLVGYAFASAESHGSKSRYEYGVRPGSLNVHLYAYRAYDCTPPSFGPLLTERDIVVADALNAHNETQGHRHRDRDASPRE